MSNISFSRSHSICINAPAADILNYVSNPNSWSEWLAATHKVISPDRPLEVGDVFDEEWHTRHGEAKLHWEVIERDHPSLWTGKTEAEFLGTILVTYKVEDLGAGQCQFTRIMINPDRPKEPTEGAINRMDEEAEIALANIKKIIEAKRS